MTMSRAERFVIEDVSEADRAAGRERLRAGASRAAGLLQVAEIALLVPWRAIGLTLVVLAPLLFFLALPFVLLGALLVLQAPVFYVMWRLAGGTRMRDADS
jgi:hypothetical protein